MSVSGVIKEVSHTAGYPTHLSDARTHLDELYPDIDVLLGHVDPSNDVRYQATRRGKRRRTLLEELEHWGREEKAASDEVGPSLAFLSIRVLVTITSQVSTN